MTKSKRSLPWWQSPSWCVEGESHRADRGALPRGEHFNGARRCAVAALVTDGRADGPRCGHGPRPALPARVANWGASRQCLAAHLADSWIGSRPERRAEMG